MHWKNIIFWIFISLLALASPACLILGFMGHVKAALCIAFAGVFGIAFTAERYF
jgi:hypothetical protein